MSDERPDWLVRIANEVTRSGEMSSRVERQEMRLAKYLFQNLGHGVCPWDELKPDAQRMWQVQAAEALDATAGLLPGYGDAEWDSLEELVPRGVTGVLILGGLDQGQFDTLKGLGDECRRPVTAIAREWIEARLAERASPGGRKVAGHLLVECETQMEGVGFVGILTIGARDQGWNVDAIDVEILSEQP